MIRLAGAADAAGIALLWNPWIRDTVITFNAVEKTAADVAQMIADRHSARHAVFVAHGPGQSLLGFATYVQFRRGVGYATCMENTIVLSPDACGKGVGRALMDAVETHARDHGAHQMIAGITGENHAGLAFHAALGYVQIAIIPQAGFKFGRFLDLVLMQKFLT